MTTTIPPVAHEVMNQMLPGYRNAIDAAAARLRPGTDLLDPKTLLERSGIDSDLLPLGRRMIDTGADRAAVLDDLDLLGIHAFYALSYALHLRKTFWIDESLGFMLGHTRLDVRGEGLRLPFPSFALVFTDRETLATAEALANRDDGSNVRGRTLRSLTVYVTQLPAEANALGIQLSFLLDANTGDWPWILTRDLVVRADDMLDEIVESRFPDVEVAALDPVFTAPELRQLVRSSTESCSRRHRRAGRSWPHPCEWNGRTRAKGARSKHVN